MLRVERAGTVLVLALDRPGAANALDSALHGALVAELGAAGADAGVTAAVLAADGERTFSAGADVKEFGELDAADAARRRRELLLRTLLAVLDFAKPLVAAVQAQALGAGCMLALVADEVIAAESARFGFPEVRLGMPSPMGAAVIAARGGRAAAQRLVQTGEPLDAPGAMELGLVDQVIAPARVRERAIERATALGALAAAAYAGNKKWMNGELRSALLRAAAEAGRLQDSLRAGKGNP